ncbi:MAG: hypothetical protein V2I40_07120 [Desulfobacteraceae bacterium]|jgi:hypothetical protein|nr:hypothetical protein [Desulfobacteraceae bacterium]
MKTRLGKKWLTVGVIWGVVMLMTGWNTLLVNQVQSRRQELGTLQMDLNFLQSRQTGIQEVHRQQSRLTHSVKSFGLGFLVVENDLKRLSWDFGLKQMQVEADDNAQDTRSATISIVAAGPVPAIVGWTAAVENAYPYLAIERMDISYDHRNRTGQLQAVFNYRYTLAEAERAG